MPTVIITGANRGLGLEFARQYAADGWTVVATGRSSDDALEALPVRFEQLDMRDLESIADFGKRVEKVDLLIANAGMYGPKSANSVEEAREWLDTLLVNSVGPYLLARSVLPRLTKSGKLIAISSRMGSIDDNSSGGFLAYRTSKTNLNSAWRNLSLDVRPKGIIATVLHPGWVKTRMGGSSAPLGPEESVCGMRRVIAELGPEDSGEFLSYDGSHIRW